MVIINVTGQRFKFDQLDRTFVQHTLLIKLKL